MDARRELRADCGRCAGLCCVAPGFARSAEFALDKPPGAPCPNLDDAHRCRIHDALAGRGFGGCVAYDCLGAGQVVTQRLFAGRSWRDLSAREARRMFDALGIVRAVHELRWLLLEALSLRGARAAHADARALLARVDDAASRDLAGIEALDVEALRSEAGAALGRASALVRGAPGRRFEGGRRDLVAVRLRGADLRAVDLRGCCLLGAELRDADLRLADLLGADLRAADVRGADLSTALFLTPPQVAAARGDVATRLPRAIPRPAHWGAAASGRRRASRRG